MKNKFFLYACITLISIILFSCSDWETDPTSVLKKTTLTEEPSGILLSTNFPKNVTAFCLNPDGVYIVGTSDGCFYKSINSGKSWIKAGEMDTKDKINSFDTCKVDESIYIAAATNRGGYLSTDYGTSWKKILGESDLSGNCILSTAAANPPVLPVLKCEIEFYGKNGGLNYFSANSSILTWTMAALKAPIENSYISGHYHYIEQRGSYGLNYILRSYQNNSSSVLGTIRSFHYDRPNEFNVVFSENMEFSGVFIVPLGSTSVIPWSKALVYLAGSKRGILRSTNAGETWKEGYLGNKKIYDIAYYSDGNQLYAGASDGLYVSVDYGITWNRVELFEQTEAITKICICSGYVYFVTESGTTYYFKATKGQTKTLYVPDLITPKDNSVCEAKPVFKWIPTDDYNTVQYNLQIAEEKSFNKTIIDTIITSDTFQSEISNSQKYYWRVRSRKIWGFSQWSDIRNLTIK